MTFEKYIRTAFDDFIKANGGFDIIENNLKDYMEEAIQNGDDLSYLAENFCTELDAFEGYLIEATNQIINDATIHVTVRF